MRCKIACAAALSGVLFMGACGAKGNAEKPAGDSHASTGGAIVRIAAVNPDAAEAGPAAGQILVSRDGGDISAPLTLNLAISGTATPGADYTAIEKTFTLEEGMPMNIIEVMPVADAVAEGPETVIVTLEEGDYDIGEEASAEITIRDAGAGAAGPIVVADGDDGIVDETEEDDADTTAPPGAVVARLTVDITLDGKGHYANADAGTYSDNVYHRELHYSMLLHGIKSPASGLPDIDEKELAGVQVNPDFERFIMFIPKTIQDGKFGEPCGHGTIRIDDSSSGLETGDPGQPPLVPFTETRAGGGKYPAADPTVPQNDLCAVAAAFDLKKGVAHLRLEGVDSNVKVTVTHNDQKGVPFNLRFQGESQSMQDKLALRHKKLNAAKTMAEGTEVYDPFNEVAGPENSEFPLKAQIHWKIERL